MKRTICILFLFMGFIQCVYAQGAYYKQRGGGLPPAEAEKMRVRMIEILRKQKDGCISWSALPQMKRSGSITALFNEEGMGNKPIRSGYEVELYKKIKDFARQRGPNDQLDNETLFRMGLETCRDSEGTVNIQDVFLTLHNVVRLLARPKNWSHQEPGWTKMQDDPVYPILKDLGGLTSVDNQPTMGDIMGNTWQGPSRDKKEADLKKMEAQIAQWQALIDAERKRQANAVNEGRPLANGPWMPEAKGHEQSPTENTVRQFELARLVAESNARIADYQREMAAIRIKMNNPNLMMKDSIFIQQYFFANENGVFKQPSGGEEPEGNGGCSYYFWLGAWMRAQIGPVSHGLATYGEGFLKWDEGSFNRGVVQLSHYSSGGTFAGRLGFMDFMGLLPCNKAGNEAKPAQGGYVAAKKEQSDWYCTNRPEIDSPTVLPDIVRKLNNKPDLSELREWMWKLRDYWKGRGLDTRNLESFLGAVSEQIRGAKNRDELPGFLKNISAAGERPQDPRGIFAWREQNTRDAYAWYVRTLSNADPQRVIRTLEGAKNGLSPEANAKLNDGLLDVYGLGAPNRLDAAPKPSDSPVPTDARAG